MSKLSVLFVVPMLALAVPSIAVEKSSNIPERREFPLDEAVSPCTDFHKYVCDKVEDSFQLREDRSHHTFAFSDSAERLLDKRKDFFKNIAQEKNLDDRGLAIKNVYMACMNQPEGVKEEKQALKDLQADVASLKTTDAFFQMNVDHITNGKPTLISFDIDNNKDNPKIYDIVFMGSVKQLPEYSYYDNADLMKNYRHLVIEFFKRLQPKAKASDIEARADRMIAFEKEFVKTYPHPDVLRQRWSEKHQEPQADFLAKYQPLHLDTISKMVPTSLATSNPVPESLQFFVDHKDDKWLDTWKDFYLFSQGSAYLDDSDPKYFAMFFDFNKKYLGGPNKRPERNERCTTRIMRNSERELDAVLLPRFFPNFPEEKVRAVAAKIKESILAGLKNNTWLSNASREKAQLKMSTAKLFLVKPQNDREWDFLPVQKYSDKKRIANQETFRKATFQKNVSDAAAPANQDAWGMGPLTVNAYYDPSANKFVLPIGILQYPFFNAEGDLIENLGAVGTVFGHELGHGIDDQGSKYDEHGKLALWMTPTELDEFSKRSKRLVEQFNHAGHNGQLTLGENSADLVGLSFSYNAAFPKGEGSVADKQKFFIAYARLWCEVSRPKFEELMIKTNPHSLGRARINEQVKHQAGFAEAFSCKETDPMSMPNKDRIKIW